MVVLLSGIPPRILPTVTAVLWLDDVYQTDRCCQHWPVYPPRPITVGSRQHIYPYSLLPPHDWIVGLTKLSTHDSARFWILALVFGVAYFKNTISCGVWVFGAVFRFTSSELASFRNCQYCCRSRQGYIVGRWSPTCRWTLQATGGQQDEAKTVQRSDLFITQQDVWYPREYCCFVYHILPKFVPYQDSTLSTTDFITWFVWGFYNRWYSSEINFRGTKSKEKPTTLHWWGPVLVLLQLRNRLDNCFLRHQQESAMTNSSMLLKSSLVEAKHLFILLPHDRISCYVLLWVILCSGNPSQREWAGPGTPCDTTSPYDYCRWAGRQGG